MSQLKHTMTSLKSRSKFSRSSIVKNSILTIAILGIIALSVTLNHSMKKRDVTPVLHGDNPDAQKDINLMPDAVTVSEKLNRVANLSYQVEGVRYYPKKRLQPFVQEGLASWYGMQFHGRLTTSGERYDMNEMTAAHKTLPIPSYARVTNLANNKSVVVRINDRGPFHSNRIIDLSYAAAKKLGYINKGIAKVRVEQIVMAYNNNSQENEDIYVTIGIFDDINDAQKLMQSAAKHLQNANTSQQVHMIQDDKNYQINIGPFKRQEDAKAWEEGFNQKSS